MASKKLGSPISSIFHQWTAQQVQHQKQSITDEVPSSTSTFSSSSSYRILLQSSYSLRQRTQAAEPVENPQLYRLAGLPTPWEVANRDSVGGSETAWLLRLIELAAMQAGTYGTPTTSNHHQSWPAPCEVKVVYVVTQPRTAGSSVLEHLPLDLQTRIQVLDLASSNPWGWDSDDEEADGGNDDEIHEESTIDRTRAITSAVSTNMKDVSILYKRLQLEMRGTTATKVPPPVILIWQSLTPLIAVHGFDKILRLIAARFPAPCLQVWPVRIQTLTPLQHMQLEDAANALMCMEDGEMTVIRQGIRERGNVVRERLAFRLVALPQVGDPGQPRRYRIVEGEDEESTKTSSSTTEDEAARNDHGVTIAAASSSTDTRSSGTGSSSSSSTLPRSGRPRIQLRLEVDGNDKPIGTKGETFISTVQSTTQPIDRPRIYLQDDDPEFADLDEEDPDDDLDI